MFWFLIFVVFLLIALGVFGEDVRQSFILAGIVVLVALVVVGLLIGLPRREIPLHVELWRNFIRPALVWGGAFFVLALIAWILWAKVVKPIVDPWPPKLGERSSVENISIGDKEFSVVFRGPVGRMKDWWAKKGGTRRFLKDALESRNIQKIAETFEDARCYGTRQRLTWASAYIFLWIQWDPEEMVWVVYPTLESVASHAGGRFGRAFKRYHPGQEWADI